MKLQGYVGCDHPTYNNVPAAIVLGHAFGPCMVAVHCNVCEALDEFDERFGERVDVDKDASTLADYNGATVAEQIEHAMECGDVRINDGGTMVWVDHHEWIRTFDTKAEARAFFASMRR